MDRSIMIVGGCLLTSTKHQRGKSTNHSSAASSLQASISDDGGLQTERGRPTSMRSDITRPTKKISPINVKRGQPARRNTSNTKGTRICIAQQALSRPTFNTIPLALWCYSLLKNKRDFVPWSPRFIRDVKLHVQGSRKC